MKQRWPRVRKRLQGQDRPRQTKTDQDRQAAQFGTVAIHPQAQTMSSHCCLHIAVFTLLSSHCCLHIAVFTLLSSLHLMAVLLSALSSQLSGSSSLPSLPSLPFRSSVSFLPPSRACSPLLPRSAPSPCVGNPCPSTELLRCSTCSRLPRRTGPTL